MRAAFLAFVLAIGAPAAAQELSFDVAETQRCLEAVHSKKGEDARQCIGMAAETCIEETLGGYSTAAMSGCYARERDWWDAELNVAYGDLMDQTREMDDLNGENAPSQALALRDMQRAWIGFRDGQCAFVHSQWGGGTGGGPAYLACQMRVTAEQTLFLQASMRQ